MKTSIERTGGLRMLHLCGRLTADRDDERLPDMVRRMVGDGARLVVLDLGNVSYMDSTCLGELVEVQRILERRGGYLVLVNVPPRVQYLLRLSRLTDVLIKPEGRATAGRTRGSAA
jgi:anti-sigma B factor antagonist